MADPRDQLLPAGGSPDPLDALLAAARWPEPPAESTRRLRRFWAGVFPARPNRWVRPAARWGAVAATLLVGGGAAWLFRAHRPVPPLVATAIPKSIPAPDVRPAATVPATARASDSPPPAIESRPPTPLESLIAIAGAREDRAGYARRVNERRVEQMIDALAADPAADPATAAGELQELAPPARLAARLTELARGPDAARRGAAARLLGSLRLPPTLPLLVELARDAQLRPAVLPAVLALTDAPALAALARELPDDADRDQALAALLGRGGQKPTALYLRALADADTRPAALRALDRLPAAPIDDLFAHLQGSDANLRLAAARALGRIDGPVVTARLQDMVRRDANRREALAALIYSDDPEAARFLQSARRSPPLAAAIDAVAAQAKRSL